MREGTLKFLCIFLCVCFTIIHNTVLHSQSNLPIMYSGVQSQGEVADLVRDSFIKSECFILDNISSRGRYDNRPSIGYFSNAESPFGFDDEGEPNMAAGLILASTSLDQISGGNSTSGAGGSPGAQDVGSGGDVDLNKILQNAGTTAGSQDVSVIEFDFIPTSNRVSFEYVFASEEYCDFVDAGFNDVFGMFLSGPGIAGGEGYSNDAINIARYYDVVSAQFKDVTIDNINNSTNANLPPGSDPLYVDNNTLATASSPSGECQPRLVALMNDPSINPHTTLSQFDGWTAVFTASYDGLTECQTYHIKIAVGDAGDNLFGSAVFLKQSSFTASEAADAAAQPTEAYWKETMDSYVYEGCGNQEGVIKLPRLDLGPAINAVQYTVPINFLNGSANYGADYTSDLDAFDAVTVGYPSACHTLEVVPDDIDEPIETIEIEIENPCGCETEIVELQIIDIPELELQPLVSDTNCFNSANHPLIANVSGGYPVANENAAMAGLINNNEITDYTYLWTDANGNVIGDESRETVDISEAGSYTYYLEVSDDCGNMLFDTVNFVTSGIPNADLDGTYAVCNENPTALLNLTLIGSPPWTLEYTLDGVAQTPIQIDDPNFEFIVDQIGEYEITRIDGANCGQDVEGLAVVSNQSFMLDVMPTPTLCNDSEDGMLMAIVSSGIGNYEYLWSDDNGQTTEMATGLAAGDYTVTVTDELGCTQELMATVSAPMEPTVSPDLVSGTTCADLASGEVSATGAGGAGDFTYEWFDNGSNSVGSGAILDGLTAGTYQVVATDANGCESMGAEVTIPSDENTPDAVIEAPNIDCNNVTVTVNSTGTSIDPAGVEFTYTWTISNGGSIMSGGDGPSAVIDQPGTYVLTVTNTTNGCTATAPITIEDNTLDPIVDAGAALDCITSAVQLGGPNMETGQDITYLWTASNGGDIPGDATIQNPMVTEAGTYEVLVTNTATGCSDTDQVIVSIAPEVAIADPAAIDCANNQTVTLSGSSNQTGTDISYEWTASNGGVIAANANSANPEVSEQGTYTLVITNTTSGCTNTMDVMVEDITTELVADPGQAAQIDCNNMTVPLGGANTSTGASLIYEWQIVPDVGAASTASSQTITATQGGTYTLLVTNTDNGCTAMDMVVINENTEIPVVNIDPPAALTCDDEDLELLSSNSSTGTEFTYIWTTSGGSIISPTDGQNVNVDNPGFYTLTIVNNTTGCEDFSTVEVITDAVLPTSFIVEPQDIDCSTTQVLLSSTGSDTGNDITYTWTDATNSVIGTDPSIMVDAGGEYTLEVSNMLTGCDSKFTEEVIDLREDPVADPGPMQMLNCVTTAITLGGDNTSMGSEYSYEWTQVGGAFTSNQANPEVMEGGEYTLVVTNMNNNCSANESITIPQSDVQPDVNVDVTGVITCQVSTQTLLTAGSSTGGEFEYSWTGPNGFVSNLENPEITISGPYELTITNTANLCSDMASVTVLEDAEFPAIMVEPMAVINCTNPIIDLSGLGSETGTDIEYSWVASNGGIIEDDEDSLEPEISAAGTYTLTVNNTASGCSRELEVVVTDDFEEPVAMVNQDLTFGCQDDFLDISGTGSSTGANIEYSWTAGQGNISGPLDALDSQIDQPGDYTLLVTNMDNGCTAEASFMVTPDAELPQIVIVEPEVITCDRAEVMINATGSDTGADLTYEWTKDGDVFTPTDNLSFMATEPGSYTLTIENTNNGCVAMGTTVVEENKILPLAEAGDGIILNCRDMMLNLDAGESSSGSEFSYSWEATNGGNIVSGNDTDEPLVDEPGTYILTVTNTLTGCQEVDEVPVSRNDFEPVIEIEEVMTLNCRDELIMIDASDSDEGDNFELVWEAVGTANIESGEQTLTPMIDAPGTYILTITNTDNFCVSTREIVVEENKVQPDATIALPEKLTCATLEVLLDASGSSEGTEFTYEWTSLSPGGSFAGATNQLDAMANSPGTYELLVINSTNFCENTFTISVAEDVEPPVAATGAAQEVTCDFPETTLSGAGSSTGSQFEYSWTPLGSGSIVSGGNTLTPTVNSEGEYQLTVLNTDNGCQSINVQAVTSNDVFPTDDVTTPVVLNCDITEQTLSGSGNAGLTYSWSTEAGGNIVGAVDQTEILIDAPGLYTMTITDIANGCSTPYQVNVLQDIEAPQVNAGDNATLDCTETIVALGGSGSEGSNFTYEWTSNGGAFSGETNGLEAFATAAGVYTLTIVNTENGCESSANVEVGVEANVPIGINAEAIPPNCFGDPGSIEFVGIDGGMGPFGYSIDGGETFSNETLFTQLTPGETYALFIQDDNGCVLEQDLSIPAVDSLTVQVAEPFVEVDLGEEFDITAFVSNIPESEIASITWTPSTGLSCDDCLNPIALPGSSINYNVVVVSENGCVDEANIQFRVDRNIDIYIPNAFSPFNADGVNDIFAPIGKANLNAKVLEFQIFDRWGEQVFIDGDFQLNEPDRGWNGGFREDKIQTGVYTYYIVLEFADLSTELYEGNVTLME